MTNYYLAAGGGEYVVLKKATSVKETFHYLRNIIAEYVKKNSLITKSIEKRIVDVARK